MTTANAEAGLLPFGINTFTPNCYWDLSLAVLQSSICTYQLHGTTNSSHSSYLRGAWLKSFPALERHSAKLLQMI